MEHEGLVRALKFLDDNNLTVGTLVTDRHTQISKYMSTQHPDIDHRFDVWHVSKGISYLAVQMFAYWTSSLLGIKKKLSRLAKTKECALIAEWIKSITNHLYWCASSAPDGEGNEIVKRWMSLADHICDVHDDCYHEPLNTLQERKKWFTPGMVDLILQHYILMRKRREQSKCKTRRCCV